ncbi:MAG: S41 family peptidase [Polyangiaceae bacterium]
MMPASNRGVGMNVGFPDVCMTPPLGVPVPYPNLAMNALSAVFSPNIFVGYMPQLNVASVVPLTLGDQAGVMHPLYMQMGGQTAGNPRVLINCLPAKHLCVPTFGNLFNNPVGLVAVPSVTTTMYSDAGAARAVKREPHGSALSSRGVRALRDAVRGRADVVSLDASEDGVAVVSIRRFTSDAPTRLWNALRRAGKVRALVLDLRGNPGGDLDAALSVAEELVPAGALLAHVDRGFGPEARASRSRPSFEGSIACAVDGATASAAEALVACLRAHARAFVTGERTAGKGSAQSAMRGARGELTYETVACVLGPDGSSYDSVGLAPDFPCAADLAVAHGLELLKESA